MQNLIISMIRFSAAVTLFGMEQIQNSWEVVEGEEDLSKTMERIEKAFNSMTDSLVERIDDKKKETLKSVTKMSEDVVGKTGDAITALDPREVISATNDLIQKTSDVTAEWVSKAASAVEKATEETKPSEKKTKSA